MFPPRLSEEQRARIRQRANVHAGIEMILLGVVVPMGYYGLTTMFFNTPTRTGAALAFGGSVILIGLGVIAILQNRKRRIPPPPDGPTG